MAYADIISVQARMINQMTEAEKSVCSILLEDAAVMIDAVSPKANLCAKEMVSCRMVARALTSARAAGQADMPIGASQGSMAALGYSQSWTLGSSGSIGELYLSKADKQALGVGNSIGSYSPTQELVGGL